MNETKAFRRHALRPKSSHGVKPTILSLPQADLSWLAGELGPDERRALREIVQRG